MQDPASKIVIVTVFTTLLILMLAGFIVSIVFFYQKRKAIYLKDLDQIKLEYDKSLLTAQLEIQESTFLNISQEIHDNIGLSLTLAKLNLNCLNAKQLNITDGLLTNSQELISKAIYDLSDLSKSFNAEIILNQGLCVSIQNEISRIKRNLACEIKFIVEGDQYYLDSRIEIILFRIFQEAINNTIKHADAKVVQVNLKYSKRNLFLAIVDDGKGFDETTTSKFRVNSCGLKNIRKRASLINAEAQIISAPGKGTRIFINLPIENLYDKHS